MIRNIVCKNERSIKCFLVFGILSFLSLLSVGSIFIYESFRDGNEPAIIGISVSLIILVFCIFVPSFVYCKCEATNPNDSESDSSDSEFIVQNLV
jgi:hypothetical protein